MLDLIDRIAFAATTPLIWAAVAGAVLALMCHFIMPVEWLEIVAGLLFLALMYQGAYLVLRRDGLTLAALYAGRWPRWIERALRVLGGVVLFVYFISFIAHADRAVRGIRTDPIAALDYGAEVVLLALPPTLVTMIIVLVVGLTRRRRTR